MANENGIDSILVLTGETKAEDLVNSRYRPTFVVNTLIDLLK
ncbi:HAD hydrolase-like protein [Vulcanisaeta sp. JCM 16161]|nr:HAD hydrolase-like protein [Vulcanisaeta sp. JCM 16161]